MEYITIAAAAVLAVALLVGVWYVRGVYDKRRATILPRLIDLTLAGVAEIQRLQAPDAAAEQAAAIAKATAEAKVAVLKAAAAKLV
jgi:hypothetical protein